jgi:hypothetical protein
MFTKAANAIAGIAAMCLAALANPGTGMASGLAGAGRMMAHPGFSQSPGPRMSFNLQYLQLQNAMQNENRQFTMVSNIMKTKHDTVRNAIGNIR